jgi:hypothetical protein
MRIRECVSLVIITYGIAILVAATFGRAAGEIIICGGLFLYELLEWLWEGLS